MIPVRIQGFTNYLGAPIGWEPDKHGPCAHLAVRVEIDLELGVSMSSAWEPTPEEIALIVAGAPIILKVFGAGHPPVWLSASEAPAVG